MIGRAAAVAVACLLVVVAGGPIVSAASAPPTASAPPASAIDIGLKAPGSGAGPSFGGVKHVNVARLPNSRGQKAPASPPVLRPSVVGKPSGARGAAPAVAVAPTPLATLTATPSIQTGTSFAGISDQTGCSGIPCIEPPDPWVAVGPEDVVQVTNAGIRFTDRLAATWSTSRRPTSFRRALSPPSTRATRA